NPGDGSFDIVLHNDGNSVPGNFAVGGFSVEVNVAGGTGILLTNVVPTTAPTYIFNLTSFGFGTTAGPPPATPNSIVSDFSTDLVNGTPVNAGDTFGLAHFTFSIDAGTPAEQVLVDIVDPALSVNTFLTDAAGGDLTPFLHTSDGNINVPE